MRLLNIPTGTFAKSSWTANIFKVLSGDLISKIIAACSIILVIRGIDVGAYARFTAFNTILSLVPGLIGGGVNLAMIRYSAEHLSIKNERPVDLYITALLIQILLYAIIGGVLFSFEDGFTRLFFGNKGFHSALQWGLLAGIGLLVIQTCGCIFQAEEKFNTYIKLQWLRQGSVLLIICILIAGRKMGYGTVVAAYTVSNIAIALAICFMIFKNADIRSTANSILERKSIYIDFIKTTGWLIAYISMLTAFQRIDIFMLSHFCPESELANYGVASQYYAIGILVLSSIHTVLLPKFSRIEMQDKIKQKMFVIKWIKYTWWIIIPILIFDLFGKPVFMLINGSQYGKAFYIFEIFSLGIWFSLMLSPLVNVLMSRREYRFLFLLSVISLTLNIILNYMFIPTYGSYAAAVVNVLCYLIINLSSVIRVIL